MSEQVKRYSLSEFAEQHTYPVGPGTYVNATDYDALHAEAEALRAENGRLKQQHERLFKLSVFLRIDSTDARILLRDIAPFFAAPHGRDDLHHRLDSFLATPALEVQAEQEQCDRDLELFGVSFSVRGRRVDPADVVWRMKHADVGAEVSRYDDFRGDNKWLVSSASSLLALDEKGALTGGGIGGHARTIIASLAARLMQQEDRQQSSQAEQGELQEAVAWQVDVTTNDGTTRSMYTERLPFVPSEIVTWHSDPVPLYATPQPGPDVRGLVEALNYACKSLCHVTSSDGSGHADIALSVLRMAGVDGEERERLVDGWKASCQWRIDKAHRQAQRQA